MADHLSPWTKTFTRDTSKDIYEEVSYDTTKPKFDVVTIESDLYLKQQFDDSDMLLFVYVNPDGIRTLGTTYKGSTYETRPAAVGDYKLHYITGENKIFWDAPNYVATENSFPIAIVDRSADIGFTSIDQAFNGFGYIGSTIFALPGVKGLIPNGRNTDGSLRNVEFTTNKVTTKQVDASVYEFGIKFENNSPVIGVYDYFSNIYDESTNTVTYAGIVRTWMHAGNFVYSSSRVTAFTPKTTFHALDYNDKPVISGWGMPSTRYIDLTLGASGATYSAPANGWFYIDKTSNATNQWVSITNNSRKFGANSVAPLSNSNIRLKCEAQKGDRIQVDYNLGGATNIFRFIYAEGESSN